ncbi:hypothetical protein CKO11_09345 [Rhodobacter sp. TJ_12]|nr:hypothetical protein [Rhodobacter sp. TJ_12]
METPFPDILTRIDAGLERRVALPAPDELLAMGEQILEAWLAARGETPEAGDVDGFRLLALHRQGCKDMPSFNACRETCREIVFRRNVALAYGKEAQTAHRLEAMVVKHLALFVGGKLEQTGLGEFCCASRPLHAAGAA